jgi:methionyl aminopeptidase
LLYNEGMNESEYQNRLKTTGRNDQCPCGSGKKYKKCHLDSDRALEHKALEEAAEARAAEVVDESEETNDSNKKSKQSIKELQKGAGKASHGVNQKANIPRRGAI